MFYFLDTSALVKRYHQELGTEVVDSLFTTADVSFVTCSFVLLETIVVLKKLRKKGFITAEEFNDAFWQFQTECESKIKIIDIYSFHIISARQLVLKYDFSAGDALILASATSMLREKPVFVCADETLLRVAKESGLNTLNPAE